ncbi:MAG TPA: hypothetical protein VF319_19260, partial [Caldimonas sp.]
MDYSRTELADRLAGEYATGTLRGAARRRFEALLPAHPLLRACTREWQERLMPLTGVLTEQTPPQRVWRRIEARIAPAAQPASARGWWASLGLWRALSSVATVAVVGMAVLLANPTAQAPVVVVLSSTEKGPEGVAPARFVASFSADGRALATRPLVPVSLEPGRALE